MDQLINLISFPFRDKKWIIKLLIGGVLSIIPIINFFSFGYSYHIFKEAIEGKTAYLPEWNQWDYLFKKGFYIFILGLIYTILPSLLIMLSLSFMTLKGPFFILGFLLILISIILYIAVLFFFPTAIALFAKKENIKDALNFSFIIKSTINFCPDYFKPFLTGIGIIIVGLIIESILGSIPTLGWLIFFFLNFYISIILARLFGEFFLRKKL